MMRHQRNINLKTEKITYVFTVVLGIIWILSLLETSCGSLTKLLHAKSLGSVMNMIISHHAEYYPIVHSVYGETGSILLLWIGMILGAGLATGCFFLAMKRGQNAFFWTATAFVLPIIAIQLWMPEESSHMLEAYLALTGAGWIMRNFGGKCKTGMAFLCILFLLSATVYGVTLANGTGEKIADLKDNLDMQRETRIYGGSDSGLTLGNFYGSEPENRTDREMLKVTMSRPQAYYLRGYVGDAYTAEGWKTAAEAENEMQIAGDNALFYELREENFNSSTMIAAASKAANVDIQGDEENVIQVVNVDASRKYLYLPYEADQIQAKGKALIGGGILPDRENAQRYAVTVMPYLTDQYGTILDGLTNTAAESNAYRIAESNYREYVMRVNTELPDECRDVITKTFAGPETIHTTGEAKGEILKKLSALEYDESITDTKSEDFVAGFLKRGVGYDKHFAAATVMAFRYYGIPARFTEGYLITDEMAGEVKAGEEIVVTASHAHCWAEYYEEGIGWIPFETTPPYIGLMKSAGSIAMEAKETQQPKQEKENKQEKNEQHTVTTESEVNYQMLALMLILLLLILITLAWVILKRLRACKTRVYSVPRKKDIKSKNRKEAVIALMYFIRKQERKQGFAENAERKAIEEIYLEARYSMHEISEEKYQRTLQFYQGMKKKHKDNPSASCVSMLLCLVITFSVFFTGCGVSKEADYEKAMENAQAYLNAQITRPASGSIGGEWAVIARVRGEQNVSNEFIQSYIDNTKTMVKEAKGILNTATGYKYTEYSRVILGWTAAGQEPTDVAGYNFLEKLTDMNNVCRQGINGPIWALIAYDCGGYAIPALTKKAEPTAIQTSREALLTYILKQQTPDGGWTLSGEAADVDLTAMALTAMAPYVCDDEKLCAEVSSDTLKEVKTAAVRAISCLAAKKLPNGGFESWGSENAESCAQVITALSALGIDVEEDERFEGTLNSLLTFKQEDGGFAHIAEGGTNMLATEQATYALVAYDRMKKGETRLFDMR